MPAQHAGRRQGKRKEKPMTRLLLTAAALTAALAGAPALAAAPVEGAGNTNAKGTAATSPPSADDNARATNCAGDNAKGGSVAAEGKMNCAPRESSGSSSGHLDTGSGGSPAAKPQGDTPPAMQAPVPGAHQREK
jgi:hypothetical protein